VMPPLRDCPRPTSTISDTNRQRPKFMDAASAMPKLLLHPQAVTCPNIQAATIIGITPETRVYFPESHCPAFDRRRVMASAIDLFAQYENAYIASYCTIISENCKRARFFGSARQTNYARDKAAKTIVQTAANNPA
jgi:hypothetical protein